MRNHIAHSRRTLLVVGIKLLRRAHDPLVLVVALRISTSTTMVFCILVETTWPTFSFRLAPAAAGACTAS